MNMSQAIRKQLIGCDLVQGVIEAVPAAYESAGMTTSPEVHTLLIRLQHNVDAASLMACQRVDASGKWQLDAKATRQYSNALKAVQDELKSQYGLSVDAIDYIKAVQVWVEDVRAGLPVHPVNRRIVWRDIADLLQAVYLGYDPEMEADEKIDAGMAKGEVFKQAAGCW